MIVSGKTGNVLIIILFGEKKRIYMYTHKMTTKITVWTWRSVFTTNFSRIIAINNKILSEGNYQPCL